MLADMQTSRGLLASERDTPAEAVLWFATASAQAEAAGDLVRRDTNHLRTGNWLRQSTLPVAVLASEGFPDHLEFDSSGELLVIRTTRDQLFVWSWRDGKILPWSEQLQNVYSVAFSPDGNSLAIGFQNGVFQIRNAKDGKIVGNGRRETGITALGFSNDGKRLAVGTGTVRVWDIERRVFLKPSWRHPQAVRTLTFNNQGDRLVSFCTDKKIRVFAVDDKDGNTRPVFLLQSCTCRTMAEPLRC